MKCTLTFDIAVCLNCRWAYYECKSLYEGRENVIGSTGLSVCLLESSVYSFQGIMFKFVVMVDANKNLSWFNIGVNRDQGHIKCEN